MGQVSVLVSVFGGETVKPELESRLVTCDNYDYYYCWLTRDIIVIIEYLWDGSTSGIFTMIVSFKALYVVSLRRPTVASFPYIYLFTFRGVASDTRSVVIYVLLGFQADYRRFPFYSPRYAKFIYCALRN